MHIRLRRIVSGAAALLLCLLTGISSARAGSADSADRFAALDAYIHDRMNATRTPGLSYAVVGPDGPVHQRSWGTDGHGEAVTADTPFLWGSVAKPVTASAVMTLVQDRRLRLDDRVVDHLPEFRFGGAAHASRVTVRHLLNQTAGIPGSATFKVTDCVDADCPRPADRIGALDDVEPLGPPGAEYAYSSANYLLLSAVVEAVTGQPYADHLRRSVLDPAGMDGAITGQASARERKLAPGHQLLWGVPAATADGVDDSGAGYGYLGGDLHDLAAFAAFQLRSGRTADGGTVLTEGSVRLMRKEGRLQPGGAGTGYGLGWRVGGLKAPLDQSVWHTGGTPGYSAMLFLLPARNRALVLQQNLYGLAQDGAMMQVGFGAARVLAGASPGDSASATTYYAMVWGLTTLALTLLLAAVRSTLLLRRPRWTAPTQRRVALTTLWCLAGALPWIALALLADTISPGQLWTWVPDAFIAVAVAAVAGAALIVLRLIRALRPPHRGSAETNAR